MLHRIRMCGLVPLQKIQLRARDLAVLDVFVAVFDQVFAWGDVVVDFVEHFKRPGGEEDVGEEEVEDCVVRGEVGDDVGVGAKAQGCEEG